MSFCVWHLLEAKLEKVEKTLISLKVNRRNLLKSAVELAKDFRQSLSLRLHKIQEIEELKDSISKFVDFPEVGANEKSSKPNQAKGENETSDPSKKELMDVD